MEETWKDIPGYIGEFQVSSKGKVKSLDRRVGKYKRLVHGCVMKHFIDDAGYPRIALNAQKKYKVHRLVAMAFIPNPYNKPCVGHLDNNRLNPCVENLEWCTVKENVAHCIKSNRQRIQIPGEHPKSKPVIAINLQTKERINFASQKDAARQLGIWQTHVNGCITGRCKTTKGYTFVSA